MSIQLDEQFIDSFSQNHLRPYAAKILAGNANVDAIETAKDVGQEAWASFWQKYADKVTDEKEVEALLVTITKTTALLFLRRNKYLQIKDIKENGQTSKEMEAIDQAMDVSFLMSSLPAHHAYILKQGRKHAGKPQEELVELIKDEYLEKFGKELNVNIMRQIRKRAKETLKKILDNNRI